MDVARKRERATEAEYLRREEAAFEKSEYINGEIVAMAGALPRHGFLCARMIIVLGTRLHGRGCAPSTSDVRILVPDTRLYTYPDVTVIRGRPVVDPDARNTVVNPSLIVEVLSKSTEAYDRGAKAAHYRRLESLQAYVFVAQREKRVEHYQRRDDGTWTLSEFTGGQTAFFSTLDIEVPVDEIYENADLYPSDEEDSGETTASR